MTLAWPILVTAAGIAWTNTVAGQPTRERFEFAQDHMGTRFRIVLFAEDAAGASNAAGAAFRTIAHLDSLFSDYRADSEVALLAQRAASGDAIAISDELWTVLSLAEAWSVRTDGAFDVTVGPLTRLWRWSARRGELPDSIHLAEALAAVGFDGLDLSDPGDSGPERADSDPASAGTSGPARTVLMRRSGMAVDLGGIAKGFAADAVLAGLRARGIASALVDAGGDLALGASPPGAAGWRVSLPGGEVVELHDVAVATSGDAYRYLEVAGVRYSHVVDPRTGLGVPSAPTVAVVARDATTADVLASSLTVLDDAAGRALVRSYPGVEVQVSGTHSWQTRGFPRSHSRPNQGADR